MSAHTNHTRSRIVAIESIITVDIPPPGSSAAKLGDVEIGGGVHWFFPTDERLGRAPHPILELGDWV
jgi:hypothetical protein